ncbi:hypothetical protein P9869_35560 [Streptomyces ossamyceticus]|nr:hypothetical protein [Streptomyces ossamyceticus]
MVSADEYVRRMEELQRAKGEAFKPLAEIMAERAALQKQMAETIAEFERKLADLDEPYGKAYVAAEKAGWTAAELAALDADEPVKRPRGRRPGKSTAAKKSAPKAPETVPEPSTPTAAVPAQHASDPLAAAAGNAPA